MNTNQNDIQELAQRALWLCMEITQRGLANAFFDYSGHTKGFCIRVHPVGYVYDGEDRAELIDTHDYFDRDGWERTLRGAIEQLEAILAAGQVITINDLPGAA